MLEAKEVNFAYLRGQPVLNDIDIKIESGEFVALLGHNGSGKTTLSRLFMALIAEPPVHGAYSSAQRAGAGGRHGHCRHGTGRFGR